MKKLFVIDASGYLYRSYFAIRNMTNSKGESTNALFGFIRSVLKLVKDFEPNYLVTVFDGPRGITKRKEIYAEYKAHREAMPQDLRYQIDWAKEFCDLIGIPKLVIPEVEADDTMATVTKWAEKNGFHVYLCTSDKDLCQLVNKQVTQLITHKDNLELDPHGVEETYGVPPEKIIDFLALTGDSSDNIPGISGIGPKTASQLLKEFNSLDALLENPGKVSGKKRQEAFRTEGEKARLSRKLVKLHLDVDVPKSEDSYRIKEPNTQKLKKFYADMNFQTLIKEMGDSDPEEHTYQLIDDPESLQKLIETLKEAKEICVDTETTHIRPLLAELVGVGFATQETKAWYIPTNGKLGLEKVIEAIKPLLESPECHIFGHNLKYDLHILKNYEIQPKSIAFDTILASYLLNSHSRQHSLDSLTLSNFGKVKIPTSDLNGKGKKQISMREDPIEKVSEYCCEDVDYTWRLKQLLEKELKERELDRLYSDLELPLMHVLFKMERQGIFLNVPHLEKIGEQVKGDIETLQEEIFQMAGEPFNLNSPKQIGEVLFEKLGIKPLKKTQTGFSTNAQVLETLSREYPICKKIIDYRTLEKLRSTYIETLPNEVNPKTGRVHPTFNQSVTATGRLSCQDPNLQNIPIRTEVGRKIREAFRPQKEGWSFLSADYSQIELRILAHLSGDSDLIEAFQNGEDIHAHTAAAIYGVPLNNVASEQRQSAKAVNFGIIYGQQAFGLAQQLDIPMRDAQAIIEAYFQKYPQIRLFIDHCKEKARQTGKAVTLTGRERLLPEISSKNAQIRQQAERLAINTPIQGTQADLIKIAMLELDRLNLPCHMILQIHDELIFEVPDNEIERVTPIIKKTMEEIITLKAPLIVDISIGKNWKEC